MTLEARRWYCSRCGIVRDTIDVDSLAPWCRHNALDTPAERMRPIFAGHPYKTGPLPWGLTDPQRTQP